jgi:hypothetical protein
VTGKVSGNTIEFKIVYTGENPGYYSEVQGEITTATSMIGTWVSSAAQSGTWTASGLAVEIPYKCVKIKEGVLKYSAGHYLVGQPLVLGYDKYGYNYQAHMFDGSYANAYLGKDGLPPYTGDDVAYLAANPSAASKWYWPYRADRVLMKWNDAWLSNLDCNGDKLLDRHYGYSSYMDSGAWLTNHQWGSYPDSTKWDYFVKIVAPPADAKLVSGNWVAADGSLIGYPIWGEFAVTQEVSNDPVLGDHGLIYKSDHPGLGTW